MLSLFAARRMTILYFCQLFAPALYGGGEFEFYSWSKELVRRGHRVIVITQRLDHARTHGIVDGIEVYRTGPVIAYGGALTLSLWENIGYILCATALGMFLLSRNRVTVVHSNTYSPAIAAEICAMFFRKPHYITVHDVYALGRRTFWATWSTQLGVSWVARQVGPLLERLVLKLHPTAFHTVSNTSMLEMKAFGAQRPIVVIPNGINMREYPEGESYFLPHQFIFIGRLVFYKNLDVVIRALPRLLREVPDATLVVVGDGPMREQWCALSRRIGVEGSVKFVGRVPHGEKVRLLSESAALLLPSLVEGFGIVILESFACCRPAVVANVMPLSDLVSNGNDGFTLPPFEDETWAHCLAELAKNPEEATTMGRRGRTKLQASYTIESVVNMLQEMYSGRRRVPS